MSWLLMMCGKFRLLFRVVRFIHRFIKPLWKQLIEIIDDVKTSGLKDEEARNKVRSQVKELLVLFKMKSLPDSYINLMIELVYFAIKQGWIKI